MVFSRFAREIRELAPDFQVPNGVFVKKFPYVLVAKLLEGADSMVILSVSMYTLEGTT